MQEARAVPTQGRLVCIRNHGTVPAQADTPAGARPPNTNYLPNVNDITTPPTGARGDQRNPHTSATKRITLRPCLISPLQLFLWLLLESGRPSPGSVSPEQRRSEGPRNRKRARHHLAAQAPHPQIPAPDLAIHRAAQLCVEEISAPHTLIERRWVHLRGGGCG